MRFYCMNETSEVAVEILDCTSVVAKDVGELLQEALQEVWYIDDTDTNLELQMALENETSGKELYQLVKQSGSIYQTGIFDKATDTEKTKEATTEFDNFPLEEMSNSDEILF